MMRSAMAFLPDSMITFMNLDRSTEPNFGSGRMSRLGTSRRRGISLPLASVGERFHTRRGRPISGHPLTRQVRDWPAAWIKALVRALSLLRALGAVLGTRLLAVFHALQVERTAHDVVANTRQILDTAAAHEHDAVLLQVVAFTADVRDDLETVGQAHLGDLAKRGVRLLRSGGVHARAHAPALRAILHRRRLGLDDLDLTAVAHKLVDGRHG